MLPTIQTQLTASIQPSEPGGKILICDMNNSQGKSLQTFLEESGFKNVVFQADITELKKKAYYFKPDVIISGNHLWEDTTGIDFIMKLHLRKNVYIIIWSENINNRVLSYQLRYTNLHFVKKSSHEIVLIEKIKKALSDYY